MSVPIAPIGHSKGRGKMARQKIMIVEDNVDTLKALCNYFHRRYEVVTARTVTEALGKFELHQGAFEMIALDASLETSGTIDTLPLIPEFRKTYKGPLVAISNSDKHNVELVAAGCDYRCEKHELPTMTERILGVAL